MARLAKEVKYGNESTNAHLQAYPPTNPDPLAGSEYNATTVSGMVFGIFMALLALYGIWQYGRQYTGKLYTAIPREQRQGTNLYTHEVITRHLLQHHRNNTTTSEVLDIEVGTISSASSR